MDPTLIVAISLVIFLAIAYVLGYHRAIGALDQKITNVQETLAAASKAKEDAIQALHDERRHHEEVLEEINLIAKRTEEQTIALRQQAFQDIEKMISTRQQAAETIIERFQSTAIQTLQAEVAAKTVATFEALVTTQFSPAQHETLNDNAVAQIARQLTEQQTQPFIKPKRVRTKRTMRRT
jgi:F0F1-type ATP synthase membrane subunit b/b'